MPSLGSSKPKAEQAIEALKEMFHQMLMFAVMDASTVKSDELVPGDIVY